MLDLDKHLIFEPAPCSRCGARNDAEAETACRPGFDQTGEANCPADGGRTDSAGRFTFPTPASLAAFNTALDAELDAQLAQGHA